MHPKTYESGHADLLTALSTRSLAEDGPATCRRHEEFEIMQ
jgi:hypothetical protein